MTINLIPNTSNQGALAGTPGTLPGAIGTNAAWTVSNIGLVQQIIGVGYDSSTGPPIPYIDIKFSGTTTGTQLILAFSQGPSTVGYPALPNTNYVQSGYVSFTNQTNISSVVACAWDEFDSGGGFANNQSTFGAVTSTLTRYNFTATTTATTASMYSFMYINCSLASVLNFTMRIAGCQLELGTVPTAFVPTPASIGTMASTSTESGVGKANFISIGTMTSTSTNSGISNATKTSVGSTSSTSVSTAVNGSSSVVSSTGTISSTSTSNAVGSDQQTTIGTISSTSTSSAVGSIIGNAFTIGSVASQSTVSGLMGSKGTILSQSFASGNFNIQGSIVSTSLASAVGAVNPQRVGTINSSSVSSARGLASISSVGTVNSLSTVSGNATGNGLAVGTITSTSTASGIGATGSKGLVSSTSTVVGSGTIQSFATGLINSTCQVNAFANIQFAAGFIQSLSFANGTSTIIANLQAIGNVLSIADVSAVGSNRTANPNVQFANITWISY